MHTQNISSYHTYNSNRPGIYVDVVSGEALFSSQNKYENGTGWLSFTKPLAPQDTKTRADYLLGYQRTEVVSKHAGSHLGHVFNDGPTTREESDGAVPTGLQYRLNFAALEFIPADRLEESGYGEYVSRFAISSNDQ